MNPPRHLIRVGPPDDTLQFDVAARDPGPPALDDLISLSVRYHADEETLLIYDCDCLILDVEADS